MSERLAEEKVQVKMSICQNCNRMFRAAVAHEMDYESLSDFLKEAFNHNLSIKTVSLTEYRSAEMKWCSCVKHLPPSVFITLTDY